MNLLMIAPLFDSRGNVRYFIGAQVDVSGLVKECTELEGLQRMLEKEERPESAGKEVREDEFKELAEMFNSGELETVRRFGGRMHTEPGVESSDMTIAWHRPRLLLKETSPDPNKVFNFDTKQSLSGKLAGVYQNVSLPQQWCVATY